MRFISIISVAFLVFCLTNGKRIVQNRNDQRRLASIIGTFGYSPSCITSSLDTCERRKNTDQSSSSSSSSTSSSSSSSSSPSSSSSSSSDEFQKISSDLRGEIRAIKALKYRPLNCADLHAKGDNISGVRTVYPYTCCPNRPASVFCDQETDGGGWTVIQRRKVLANREDFYRTWIEYVYGFGNVTGEYWLGLDDIHALVSTALMELRVDLKDFDKERRWAKYGKFHVGDSASKYILSVGRYSGNAGDSLSAHDGFKFSTHDADHDTDPVSCAKKFRGAWWYNACHKSNLNGFPEEAVSTNEDGISWDSFRGHKYSLKKSVMSVRPKFKFH